MNVTPSDYIYQGCTLTLQEALNQVYIKNHHLADLSKFSSKAKNTLEAHDVIHIVFGLNNSVIDEICVGTWGFWGTDVGIFRHLSHFMDWDIIKFSLKQIFFNVGLHKVIFNYINSIPKQIKIYKSSRFVTKKWEFYNYTKYLDTKLFEIRIEHGIILVP
jgi:hypothetical protein